MNYLAHLFLSPRDRHSMLGNLMGDFRKYLSAETLPWRVSAGIETHRRVDRFTDAHPVVSDLKGLFSKGRRRFAGIIIDVAFDHFLSRHWQRYGTEQRDEFIRYAYHCLTAETELMPARMRQVTQSMIRDDWLGSYADIAGIDRALNGMSRRIRFPNRLAGSAEEIAENYRQLEQGFLEFFPALAFQIRRGESPASDAGHGLNLNHDIGVKQAGHA